MVLSEIESHTQAGVSPVTGNKLRKLSKEYAKYKKSIGKGSDADLHLFDTMISSIQAVPKASGIDFKITNPTEKKKSYNHNVGDTLPRRPFLPDDSSDSTRQNSFTGSIKNKIKEIIKEMSESSDE